MSLVGVLPLTNVGPQEAVERPVFVKLDDRFGSKAVIASVTGTETDPQGYSHLQHTVLVHSLEYIGARVFIAHLPVLAVNRFQSDMGTDDRIKKCGCSTPAMRFEEDAREATKGLWADPQLVPPWESRRRRDYVDQQFRKPAPRLTPPHGRSGLTVSPFAPRNTPS